MVRRFLLSFLLLLCGPGALPQGGQSAGSRPWAQSLEDFAELDPEARAMVVEGFMEARLALFSNSRYSYIEVAAYGQLGAMSTRTTRVDVWRHPSGTRIDKEEKRPDERRIHHSLYVSQDRAIYVTFLNGAPRGVRIQRAPGENLAKLFHEQHLGLQGMNGLQPLSRQLRRWRIAGHPVTVLARHEKDQLVWEYTIGEPQGTTRKIVIDADGCLDRIEQERRRPEGVSGSTAIVVEKRLVDGISLPWRVQREHKQAARPEQQTHFSYEMESFERNVVTESDLVFELPSGVPIIDLIAGRAYTIEHDGTMRDITWVNPVTGEVEGPGGTQKH